MVLAALTFAGGQSETSAPEPTTISSSAQGAEELFVRRIQPLINEKCIACHGGNDQKEPEGNFDMRSLATLVKGGDSETAALIPGKPDESPLYLAVTRTDAEWSPMPPKRGRPVKRRTGRLDQSVDRWRITLAR